MTILIITLRIIHIFTNVFWAGFAIFNIGFFQPTVRALGPDGQKVMAHLTQKTRLLPAVYSSATLSVISGVLLYWISVGFREPAMMSGKGLVLAGGGLSGIIAWVYAIIVVRGITGQMVAIGKEIQAQGGPPTPEQGALMQTLVTQLGKAGKVALTFILIALLGMASARYL